MKIRKIIWTEESEGTHFIGKVEVPTVGSIGHSINLFSIRKVGGRYISEGIEYMTGYTMHAVDGDKGFLVLEQAKADCTRYIMQVYLTVCEPLTFQTAFETLATMNKGLVGKNHITSATGERTQFPGHMLPQNEHFVSNVGRYHNNPEFDFPETIDGKTLKQYSEGYALGDKDSWGDWEIAFAALVDAGIPDVNAYKVLWLTSTRFFPNETYPGTLPAARFSRGRTPATLDLGTGSHIIYGEDLRFYELVAASLQRMPLYKNKQGQPSHNKEDGSDWSVELWLVAAMGEFGEMCNKWKKIKRGDYGGTELLKANEEVAKEWADFIIYSFVTAFRMGIDPAGAVRAKFNETSKAQDINVTL